MDSIRDVFTLKMAFGGSRSGLCQEYAVKVSVVQTSLKYLFFEHDYEETAYDIPVIMHPLTQSLPHLLLG